MNTFTTTDFGFVCHINLRGLFNAKAIFVEEQLTAEREGGWKGGMSISCLSQGYWTEIENNSGTAVQTRFFRGCSSAFKPLHHWVFPQKILDEIYKKFLMAYKDLLLPQLLEFHKCLINA